MIRAQTCPICGNELPAEVTLDSGLFPFCSRRCRDVDLYRWSEGKYAIVEPLDPNRHEFDESDFEE